MATVKAATSVASEDILFHRTSTPEFGALLDRCDARLRKLTNQLLYSAGSGTTVAVPRLKDVDDVDLKWSGIVEVVDDLLEKAV
jgi:exosome complex exonuclease RRP6